MSPNFTGTPISSMSEMTEDIQRDELKTNSIVSAAAGAIAYVAPVAGLSALKTAIAAGAVVCTPKDNLVEAKKNKHNI